MSSTTSEKFAGTAELGTAGDTHDTTEVDSNFAATIRSPNIQVNEDVLWKFCPNTLTFEWPSIGPRLGDRVMASAEEKDESCATGMKSRDCTDSSTKCTPFTTDTRHDTEDGLRTLHEDNNPLILERTE
jgi:hypothetical protein